MKYNRKSIITGLLVLLAPMLLIFLLMPVLPDNIPIHQGLNGTTYIDKHLSYILGVLPFLVYLRYRRR